MELLHYLKFVLYAALYTVVFTVTNDFINIAMQMWTVGRFLPLAIGHLIPTKDEHWENFLRLLDIMDIVFSRKIISEDCGFLEVLISDHHSCFKDLYPDVKITLKMYSMIHYPRLTLE